jgi:multiple sugar transport system permease protein
LPTPRAHQQALAPFILLAPACLLFSVFVLYPIVQSLAISLYDWHGFGPGKWVGAENYRELLADHVFWTALSNNGWLLAIYALAPVFGLLLALFLSQSIFGIRLIRSLFFAPFVISTVVVGLVFSWFLNGQTGLLNEILSGLGLKRIYPLDDEDLAILAIGFAGLWPQTAYCTILYLTGLTTINPDLIDTARVEGARGFTMLWHVVLPQLRPITFIAVMVSIVGALRSFDLVMIMTAGGPYNSSTVLGYYMYEQTFLSLRYGYGAAIAAVLFALMSGCVFFFLVRLVRRERM